MQYKPLNFKEKLELFDEHWAPKVIAEMNDDQFKRLKIQGDFVWPDHADTDENFIALDGRLVIDFRHGQLELRPGEMYLMPGRRRANRRQRRLDLTWH